MSRGADRTGSGLSNAKEKGIERGEEKEDDIKECAETQESLHAIL